MEGGFAFNWIAIAIYSRLEDVSDQENTAHDWSGKDFSILVGVDVVRGAIIPLQTYTYIYIYITWIDWRWVGQRHSQPFHFNFFKYIYLYIYLRSAIPLQIYIYVYIYKEVGVDWRHSTANIYVKAGASSSLPPTDREMRRTTFKQLLQQQKDRLNDPLQRKTHGLNKYIYHDATDRR